MLSKNPYLLRALYEWISDSNCTPIIVVKTKTPKINIPKDFMEEEEVLFNISDDAIRDFKISYEKLSFNASFAGVIHFISIPLEAVVALYAEENGEGYLFALEEFIQDHDQSFDHTTDHIDIGSPNISHDVKQAKPFLKLVE